MSFLYALLSAFTPILYRGKEMSELSSDARDILYKRASIVVRIRTFFINVISSIIAPQVHIVSGLVAGVIYLFWF